MDLESLQGFCQAGLNLKCSGNFSVPKIKKKKKREEKSAMLIKLPLESASRTVFKRHN